MAKTCPDRLVELFDNSPAEASRRLRLDRQMVHQWVIKGYIPERHALDVERVSQGRITIREMLEEAARARPLKLKSRESY